MKQSILDQLVVDQQDQIVIKSDKCQPNNNNTVKVIKVIQDIDNFCLSINPNTKE